MDGSAPMRPENVRYGKGHFDREKMAPVYERLVENYVPPVGPATEKGYSQHQARINKVSYSHDAMIDAIIANPRVTQLELATMFGYTPQWVCRVHGSDAFQAALAKRREEITDPFLIATVEERLNGLARQSMDIIAEKLQATQSLDAALKVADMSVKALGFGAREKPGAGANASVSFVVNLPPKASSAEAWADAAQRGEFNPTIHQAKVAESLPLSTTITRDPTIQPDNMKTTEE